MGDMRTCSQPRQRAWKLVLQPHPAFKGQQAWVTSLQQPERLYIGITQPCCSQTAIPQALHKTTQGCCLMPRFGEICWTALVNRARQGQGHTALQVWDLVSFSGV